MGWFWSKHLTPIIPTAPWASWPTSLACWPWWPGWLDIRSPHLQTFSQCHPNLPPVALTTARPRTRRCNRAPVATLNYLRRVDQSSRCFCWQGGKHPHGAASTGLIELWRRRWSITSAATDWYVLRVCPATPQKTLFWIQMSYFKGARSWLFFPAWRISEGVQK